MGALDKKQKAYFKEPRRFADAWNGILFQGQEVIRWNELQECDSVLTYGEGKGVERTADVIMKKTLDGKLLAMLVLENQEKEDYSLPVRLLLEEALAYNSQVRAIKNRNREKWKIRIECEKDGEILYQFTKKDRLRPVVMMVLYWNDEEWDGANSLDELIDFDEAEEMRDLILKYPIRVIDMSKLENPGRFQTDLRSVVEYFQRRNDKESFWEYSKTCDERYDLDSQGVEVVKELVGSAELGELIKKSKKKGDQLSMCKAIMELIEDAKKEERVNTEREKARADEAEANLEEEKARAEKEIAYLRAEIERLSKRTQ